MNSRARISVRKPRPQRIRGFVAGQRELHLSYPLVGATRHLGGESNRPPAGDYNVDIARERLGTGQPVHAAAVAALSRWAMFDVGWVELCWPNTHICTGSAIAVLTRIGPGWVLNAARIVYVIAEIGEIERFGFATGTLPGHMMRGEERFLIEWNRRTDEVSFEIAALSRPQHPISWLSYPMVRSMQSRFQRDACVAMRKAVA